MLDKILSTMVIAIITGLCSWIQAEENKAFTADHVAKSIMHILNKYDGNTKYHTDSNDELLAYVIKTYRIYDCHFRNGKFPRDAYIEIIKSKNDAMTGLKRDKPHWWDKAIVDIVTMSDIEILALNTLMGTIENPPVKTIDVPLIEKTIVEKND